MAQPIESTTRRALLVAAAVFTMLGASAAHAAEPERCDTRVVVRNQSTAAFVQEVYFRREGVATWGADRLGGSTLGAGQSVQVTPEQPGWYDILVIQGDGKARVLWRQNVCHISKVTISESEIRADF